MIIDAIDESGMIGRSQGDAPEIDGSVFIELDPTVAVGDIVMVRIEEADEYDLHGVIASA